MGVFPDLLLGQYQSKLNIYLTDQAGCRFMDKTVPGKEAPEEVTRESLIAISYPVPDKVPTSKLSSEKSEKLNSENLVEAIDSNGEEKCRSELISISYTQSSETGGLPVSPRELKG
uniref:Uncharacterized protein n=1 Tax=Fagus sylvatica TaxID=28930 RepID=A0A2N9IZZ1_FAGSY